MSWLYIDYVLLYSMHVGRSINQISFGPLAKCRGMSRSAAVVRAIIQSSHPGHIIRGEHGRWNSGYNMA